MSSCRSPALLRITDTCCLVSASALDAHKAVVAAIFLRELAARSKTRQMAQPQAIARFALAGARAARVSVVTRRRPHALRCVHARSDAAQMIQVGDTLPDATLVEKHEEVNIRDLFKGKTSVLLGMPGELLCAECGGCRSPYACRLRVLAPLARRRLHTGLHKGA